MTRLSMFIAGYFLALLVVHYAALSDGRIHLFSPTGGTALFERAAP